MVLCLFILTSNVSAKDRIACCVNYDVHINRGDTTHLATVLTAGFERS